MDFHLPQEPIRQEESFAMSGNGLERDVRPWGSYDVVDTGTAYKTKRIIVRPGARLSYQRHRRRAEHWFLVVGEACVTLDGQTRTLGAGESIDIPLGAAHRVANTGPGELVFFEVQTGDYFGEDDVERLDDDYGRAP